MPRNQPELVSEAAFRAFHIVELMRSTGEHEFPAPLMACFFWIAAHDGCRQQDLIKAVNMSASSVSRNVTWLGPKHRLETRSGLKLIRRERDPDNYKAWRIYLTPKGKVFIGLLNNYLSAPLNQLKTYEPDTDDQDLG